VSRAAAVGRWLRRHGGLVLILAALAARAPFATMLMCGEEGEFGRAAIGILQAKRPALVIARDLGGREYTTPPGHNLGGYALPALVVGPAIRFTGFSSVTRRTHAAIALRLAFLTLYGLALVAALLMIPRERRLVGGLVLALLSLFPLPLLASLQVQYDGAVSTLLLTLAVLAMTRGLDGARLRPWLLAAGGFAVALGKLEYLGVAACTMVVVAAWERRPLALVAFAAGALVASALCYEIDRDNFLGGYDVMRRFSGMQEHVPLGTRVRAYLPQFAALLWPLYLALPVAVVGFAVDRERRVRRALLAPLVAALLVFGGYAAIAWQGDGFPRYFAPAFVLVAVPLAQLRVPPRLLALVAIVAVAPFAVRAWIAEARAGELALCSRESSVWDARQWSRDREVTPPLCVPVVGMQSGAGFYSRRAPFACCGAQWTPQWPELTAQLCR
jgi:hypothetical protein